MLFRSVNKAAVLHSLRSLNYILVQIEVGLWARTSETIFAASPDGIVAQN